MVNIIVQTSTFCRIGHVHIVQNQDGSVVLITNPKQDMSKPVKVFDYRQVGNK